MIHVEILPTCATTSQSRSVACYSSVSELLAPRQFLKSGCAVAAERSKTCKHCIVV